MNGSTGDVTVKDYVTGLSVSGRTVTYTRKDGTSGTITTQDTDTVYTHPSSHPASMITGLATVATSGSYNDLTNRPSIPATPKAYVTATYSSGSSWYRKWSDGFIEQGGILKGVTSTPTNVSYPIAFSNTNYSLVFSHVTTHTGYNFDTFIFPYSKSTTGFAYRNANAQEHHWMAFGY